MRYSLILLSAKDRDFSDSVSLPLLAPDSNASLPVRDAEQDLAAPSSGQAGSGSQRHHQESLTELR